MLDKRLVYEVIVSYTKCMKNRDQEHLDKLRDYYAKHRVLPSFAVIAEQIGFKATSAVSVMVERMKAAGYLQSAPGRRLQPGKRFFEREILDTIQAGQPQPANEPGIEGLNIDSYLIENPSRTVLLTVKGDSMMEAGLFPGDIVIVKKDAPANIGDIVVARVDGDFTVKYLAKDKRGFYLKPGNKTYSLIRPKDDLDMFGVVVGSIRKYAR